MLTATATKTPYMDMVDEELEKALEALKEDVMVLNARLASVTVEPVPTVEPQVNPSEPHSPRVNKMKYFIKFVSEIRNIVNDIKDRLEI